MPQTRRSAWLDHGGPLPMIEGTLIGLRVDHLPGDRDPQPVWPWCPVTGAAPAEVDRRWQAFLRRFDLEHLPAVQAGPWLDRPETARPGRRGPVDLDRDPLPCPAPARPAAGGGPAPALGTARPGRAADPASGSPGVPEHPPGPALPGRCAETRQARPRTAARVDQPAPRTPPRRREDHEEGCLAQGTARTRRLNDKLSLGFNVGLDRGG